MSQQGHGRWPTDAELDAMLPGVFGQCSVSLMQPRDTKLLQNCEFVVSTTPAPTEFLRSGEDNLRFMKSISVTLEVPPAEGKTTDPLTDWLMELAHAYIAKGAKAYVMPEFFDPRPPLTFEQQLMLHGEAQIDINEFARQKLSRLQYDQWLREAYDRAARARRVKARSLTCLSCGRDSLGTACSCGA